jgi:hypothetical protein
MRLAGCGEIFAERVGLLKGMLYAGDSQKAVSVFSGGRRTEQLAEVLEKRHLRRKGDHLSAISLVVIYDCANGIHHAIFPA